MDKFELKAWRERFRNDIEAAGFTVPSRRRDKHIDYLLGELQTRIDKVPDEKRDTVLAKLAPVIAIPATREKDFRSGLLCLTSEFVFFTKAPLPFMPKTAALEYHKRKDTRFDEVSELDESDNIRMSVTTHSVSGPGFMMSARHVELFSADDEDAQRFVEAAKSGPSSKDSFPAGFAEMLRRGPGGGIG